MVLSKVWYEVVVKTIRGTFHTVIGTLVDELSKKVTNCFEKAVRTALGDKDRVIIVNVFNGLHPEEELIPLIGFRRREGAILIPEEYNVSDKRLRRDY